MLGVPVRPWPRTPLPVPAGAEPVEALAEVSVDDVAELVGGPCDGQTFGLAGCGSRDYLVIPVPRTPGVLRIAPGETHPTAIDLETALYRRDAISDRSHRWRYVFCPSR